MVSWDNFIRRDKRLKQAVAQEYSSVRSDISKITDAFSSSKSGKFAGVQESGDTAVYFYLHANRAAFSSVTCTKLVKLHIRKTGNW